MYLTFLKKNIYHNSGSRKHATRIVSDGVVKCEVVGISPLTRINEALSLMTTSSQEASLRSIETVIK